MPRFEMTPAEEAKYGSVLSIWDQILLIQAWAPMWTFAQRFLATPDPFARAVVIGEACEWLASKTDATLDDELVKKLAAMLKTAEGEAMVRWLVAKVQGAKA